MADNDTLVPWTKDTLPQGTIWIRRAVNSAGRRGNWMLVTAVEASGTRIPALVTQGIATTMAELANGWLWSPDRTDERPCGTPVAPPVPAADILKKYCVIFKGDVPRSRYFRVVRDVEITEFGPDDEPDGRNPKIRVHTPGIGTGTYISAGTGVSGVPVPKITVHAGQVLEVFAKVPGTVTLHGSFPFAPQDEFVGLTPPFMEVERPAPTAPSAPDDACYSPITVFCMDFGDLKPKFFRVRNREVKIEKFWTPLGVKVDILVHRDGGTRGPILTDVNDPPALAYPGDILEIRCDTRSIVSLHGTFPYKRRVPVGRGLESPLEEISDPTLKSQIAEIESVITFATGPDAPGGIKVYVDGAMVASHWKIPGCKMTFPVSVPDNSILSVKLEGAGAKCWMNYDEA